MIQLPTNIRKLLLTALSIVSACVSSSAQGVYTYDSKKGLSNSQVQTIYEDSRNNIWITTRNGLNRFDGVKMNVYRHSDEDINSLKTDMTNCVFEYDKEHLLVGTGSGIQSYSHATNKFTNVPIINDNGDTINVHAISFSRLRSGDVYVCAAYLGASKIVKDANGRLYAKNTTDFSPKNSNSTPTHIFEDSKGTIWVIDNRTNLFIKENNNLRQISSARNVRRVCESSTGKIYAGSSSDGLLTYNKANDSFVPVSHGAVDFSLWTISPWTEGRIFICTDGHGLRVYDEKTGNITQSTIQVNDFNLSTSNVKDAICDSFGSVWVGIYWRGVMQKTANQSNFDYVGKMSITKNIIGNNPITAIANAGNERLWVATDHDGLYKISTNGLESTHWSPESTPNMPSTINAIYADNSHNRIWLGSYGVGLRYMDENQGKVFTPDVSIPRVFDICKSNDGGIWVATMGNGLYYHNPYKGKTIHYLSNSNEPNTRNIPGIIYVTCAYESGNSLYLGSPDGLNVFKASGADLKHTKKVIDAAYVNTIKLKDNELWVATNKGIYVVNTKSNDVVATYNMSNGLPNNVVNSIEFDNNNIWFGTDNGLACYNQKEKVFHNFFAEDGLQDNEFGLHTSLKIGNNLWFGGISGLNQFSSKSLNRKQDNQEVKLKFINLYLNNKQIYQGDLSNNDYNIIDGNINEVSEVNLAHNDNSLSLEVAALGLGYGHAIFEYSLDGSDWTVQSEHTNNIILSGLKRGTHKLKVRAITYQDRSEEKVLTIIVHNPWYLSPIAYLVYLAILLLIAWGIYSQAKRSIEARRILANHRKEEEMNEARIQFFMNISHEIRTPMTLIFAPLEKLMNSDKDESRQRNYKLINQNAKRIMRLINQLMDVRKIEKGQYKLDFRPIEIVDFIQSIYDVFVTTAQNRAITFEFNHSVKELYVKADPENLDKIIMNLLSNAFKFTPDKGKIVLSLEFENNQMIIKVTDTGSGISDADKPKIFERFYSAQQQNGYIGTGIGLNLTFLIVQLHNGSISVNDNPEEKGTQFVVNIPYVEAEEIIEKEAEEYAPSHEEEDIDLPTAKSKNTRHCNLVVCEDDNAIRSYVRSELSTDFRITEFSNGQEGWEYIQKNPDKVDLIITDIMMPVMDGLALCDKVKHNYNTSHIPIIMTTALGTDADRIAGLDTGADAYVTKPFNMEVLRSTANSLLTNRIKVQGKFAAKNIADENIEKREIQSADDYLLTRVIKVINEHIDDPELNVEVIADKVGISRVHFYRKMKELTGQSPREFLKTIRLKEAARLLTEKNLDITTVCVETGFRNLSSFSTSFKGVYGISPTEYAKEHKATQGNN